MATRRVHLSMMFIVLAGGGRGVPADTAATRVTAVNAREEWAFYSPAGSGPFSRSAWYSIIASV
jgi:hypothetical protein